MNLRTIKIIFAKEIVINFKFALLSIGLTLLIYQFLYLIYFGIPFLKINNDDIILTESYKLETINTIKKKVDKVQSGVIPINHFESSKYIDDYYDEDNYGFYLHITLNNNKNISLDDATKFVDIVKSGLRKYEDDCLYSCENWSKIFYVLILFSFVFGRYLLIFIKWVLNTSSQTV